MSESITLGEALRRLRKLTLPVVQKETEQIILKDPQAVIRKKNELKAGARPDGSLIGQYRSESYRLFKLQLNPLAGGDVDLILTGSTRDNLEIVAYGNGEFGFRSTDDKWDDLVEKYNKGAVDQQDLTVINSEVWRGFQQTRYAPELLEAIKRISDL